jgi:hypothetical protein
MLCTGLVSSVPLLMKRRPTRAKVPIVPANGDTLVPWVAGQCETCTRGQSTPKTAPNSELR